MRFKITFTLDIYWRTFSTIEEQNKIVGSMSIILFLFSRELIILRFFTSKMRNILFQFYYQNKIETLRTTHSKSFEPVVHKNTQVHTELVVLNTFRESWMSIDQLRSQTITTDLNNLPWQNDTSHAQHAERKH